MSKGNTFENDLLKLIFQAVDITTLADNAATSPEVNLSVSLHTADPGEAGAQNTNEATFGGYTRINVGRTATGWAVAANIASPVADITFPQASSATNTITHFGVGNATSGAGVLFYFGTVTPNIVITSGITARLTTDSTITED